MNIVLTGLTVFGGLFVVGFLLSIIFSTLKCSKRDFSVSAKEGVIWSVGPTSAYFACMYISAIRLPIARVLVMLSASPEKSEMLAVGYLMMLASWVSTTYMIHSTESEVCQPSKDEMKQFQADLLKKLDAKEKEKDANEKKPTT